MANRRSISNGTKREGDAPATTELPPIICPRCKGPIIRGQQVAPVFAAKPVQWSEHPVLSKPLVVQGLISTNGTPGRVDMSLGQQLRQRAAMGGEREKAELAAFEKLLAEWIAKALVAELRTAPSLSPVEGSGD